MVIKKIKIAFSFLLFFNVTYCSDSDKNFAQDYEQSKKEEEMRLIDKIQKNALEIAENVAVLRPKFLLIGYLLKEAEEEQKQP